MLRVVLGIVLIAVCIGTFSGVAAAQNEQQVIRGKLTREGPNFVITTDNGERIVCNWLWKLGRVEKALDKNESFYFRISYLGKSQIRLWEAYQQPPVLGAEAKQSVDRSRLETVQKKKEFVQREYEQFQWDDRAINSARGSLTFDGNALVGRSTPTLAGRRSSDASYVAGRIIAIGSPGEVRPAELSEQRVIVTFDSEDAARRAYLQPLPLFRGYELAFCCRWDDNDPGSDLLSTKTARRCGVGCTSFICGDSDAEGAPQMYPEMGRLDRDAIQELLRLGGSIGNHSYSHPAGFIHRSRNRQMWECMKTRAEREAIGDCRIMSVAPPFNSFGDERTIDMWINAGHYGFANDAGGFVSRHGTADLLYDQALQVYGNYHARGNGRTPDSPVLNQAAQAWLEAGSDKTLWKPNFNQYAAYRFQYEHTGIQKKLVGNDAIFTLYRPCLIDLNEPQPLTFVVRGALPEEVRGVRDPSGAVITPISASPMGKKFDGYAFDLDHDPREFLPLKIGFTENVTNSEDFATALPDADFPTVAGLLFYRDGALHLKVANRGERPITELTVTWRLPLGWSRMVTRLKGLRIDAGTTWSYELPLTATAPDFADRRGDAYFTAQLDFKLDGQPSRLFLADYYRVTNEPAPEFPAGHFVAAGPFITKIANVGATLDPKLVRTNSEKLYSQLRSSPSHVWEDRDDGNTYDPSFVQLGTYDPSIRPPAADELHLYAARGIVESDVEREVVLITQAEFIAVNGNIIEPQSTTSLGSTYACRLNSGHNEFILVAPLNVTSAVSRIAWEFKLGTLSGKRFERLNDGLSYRKPE